MAKVSRATVTRVISEPEKVNPETREKVLKVMKELNYIPNFMASSLKSSKSHSVGLIIPDLVNPFYIDFAYSLQRKLHERQYNLIIQLSNESTAEESNCIQTLLRYKVECLLFAPIETTNNILSSIDYYKGKLLQIFRKTYDELNSVFIDDENGAYIATMELLKKGHTNIALFEGITSNATSSRLVGCKRAFHEFGLTFPEENYIPLDVQTMKLEDITNILLNKRITGCIVVSYKPQELFLNALNTYSHNRTPFSREARKSFVSK